MLFKSPLATSTLLKYEPSNPISPNPTPEKNLSFDCKIKAIERAKNSLKILSAI